MNDSTIRLQVAPPSAPSPNRFHDRSRFRSRQGLQWLVGVTAGSTLAGAALMVGFGVVPFLGSSDSLSGPVDLAGSSIGQLRADTGSYAENDFDGDGISDAQEEVLGLEPFLFDTDFDGFSDGEEIARQSDPLDDLSIPTNPGISASLTANGGASNNFRLVIVIHEPAEEVGQSKIRIGALTADRSVAVPIERFLGFADVLTSAGSDGSRITSVDVPIQSAFVHANEHVAFFLAAGNQFESSFTSGAKIDVRSSDGVLMLLRPVASNSSNLQQGGGSIRQPLPPAGAASIPDTWVPGAICFQRTTTVGGSGAVVVKQIVEASCLSGHDSYCASSCSSSVGTTYRTIDPGVFIGG